MKRSDPRQGAQLTQSGSIQTHATQLLIRSPKALHVRKHSANETHTVIVGSATFECDGRKAEFGPGGYNYMPARMVHEAWVAAGAVAFITVDGRGM